MKKTKNLKSKYSFKNYIPNKNCKPCVVNGIKYLSKTQACVLEGMTYKELTEYLNATV